MTESTAKPRAGAKSQQGSAMSARKKSIKNPNNLKRSRNIKVIAPPDKAMLLALFTLPDIEEAVVEETIAKEAIVNAEANELSNTHTATPVSYTHLTLPTILLV